MSASIEMTNKYSTLCLNCDNGETKLLECERKLNKGIWWCEKCGTIRTTCDSIVIWMKPGDKTGFQTTTRSKR